MARRTTTKKQAEATTEAETSTVTESPEEATVSTDTSTAPEAEATETEATEATEGAAESTGPEFDLTEFQQAVEAAIAEKDDSTGDVPEAGLAQVTAAYRALDGVKAKNAAKKAVNDVMVESMNSMDIVTARSYLQISEHLTAGAGKGGGERQSADPTEAFAQRVGALRLANALVVSTLPEGVDETWESKAEDFVTANSDLAQEYLDWLQADEDSRGEEPEVTGAVRNAVKLALGKAAKAGGRTSSGSGSYSGERRDIGKHIREAFADQPVGTFLTIAEIRKFHSSEYGESMPSAGAISARLFPGSDGTKSTMRQIGLESTTNEKGNKGAIKQTDGDPLD